VSVASGAGNDRAVWPSFVWSSLGIAIAAGFGLGGFLYVAETLGVRGGLWLPAAAQAHGHIQLFGWAGLMVLGIGLHFLPRLLGAPLSHPGRAQIILVLFLTGLILRSVTQPALALVAAGIPALVVRVGLTTSGLLELAAATLFVGLLGQTLRSSPSLRQRTGVWMVLPFFAVAFIAFWLALVVNLAGLAVAVLSGHVVIEVWIDRLEISLALYGFLIPVAVAMSVRTFPLYFRTPQVRLGVLRAGLVISLTGLGLRAFGELAERSVSLAVGQLLQAIALLSFAFGVGIFARRRPLPRQPVRLTTDAIQLHVITAWLWLLVTAVLLALSSFATMGVIRVTIPGDAERHLLGAGFITLLILGVGAHLLPGFARRPLRSRGLVWTTLALANVAAILRVGPLFLPADLPSNAIGRLFAAAGLAGVAALVLFAVNLLPQQRKLTGRINASL